MKYNCDLTELQSRVLTATMEGKRNRVIAAELNISEQTVKNALRGCFDKLGAYNRIQAVRYAISRGVLHSGYFWGS